MTATVDRALTRLQTDHLDVMLLHTCGLELLRRGDALEALVRARQAGKVRQIGYSGDNEAAAYAASLPDVAVVETSLNICDQANIDSVLLEARARDVAIIGTTNPDHARANLAAAAHGPLPEAELQKVREAFRKAESASGEKWEGLT